MTFRCKTGCGECCGIIEFERGLWNSIRHLAVREVKEEIEFRRGRVLVVIPTTYDLRCPFLTESKRCAIYFMRPMICELYGTIDHLPCPYRHPDGTPRKPAEVRRMKELIGKSNEDTLAAMRRLLIGQVTANEKSQNDGVSQH